MGKPRISVICCTRGRIDLLRKMLLSLYETASSWTGVEVVLRVDSDDQDTISFLRYEWPMLAFIVGPRKSGYQSLAAMTNEAARLSQGDVVLIVNDDAVFLTQNWDLKLLTHATQYPDGMFVLGCEVQNADNFVFPCTSRQLIRALGYVFDERLVYTDIWIRDALAHFGRAIRVHDVQISHNWQGMSDDQQKAVAKVNGAANYPALYATCVREAREKIQQVIHGN